MKCDKFLIYTLLVICTIDLSAPIIVYGTQIIGVTAVAILMVFKRNIFNLQGFILFLVVSLFLLIISYVQESNLKYSSMIWLYTLRTLYWIFLFVIIYPYIKSVSRVDLMCSLRCWIVIYSIFLFYQYINYYFFNVVIDYSVLLGGEPSRMFNNLGLRPSGLTSEPSIYSGIMISLLSLYYFLNGNRNTVVIYIGIFSIFFTYSTLGILLAIAFLIVTNLKKINAKSVSVLIFSFVLVCIYFLPSILSRFDKISTGSDVSNNIKFEVVQGLFNESSIMLLGYGLIGNSPDAPAYYQALYDLTYFGNLIVIFGLPIGIIFIAISLYFLLRSSFTYSEKIIILLTLVKITIPNFIFFYFLLAMLLYCNDFRRCYLR
ncbi:MULTISPECIES: hypothetical protein [Citrobacter]|uniref:hypothetical protein n=1 Tax=Citrobacter TaxID=544 RepID=UPI000A6E8A3E|nr:MULTISPECIES: hypothetical protein [Citrobacter]QLZ41992.1 hypothetical protein HV084_14965 [Citrobacter sp. RHBSTW-00127]